MVFDMILSIKDYRFTLKGVIQEVLQDFTIQNDCTFFTFLPKTPLKILNLFKDFVAWWTLASCWGQFRTEFHFNQLTFILLNCESFDKEDSGPFLKISENTHVYSLCSFTFTLTFEDFNTGQHS